MRGVFSARQTFAVAVGVGLAVAVAPIGVEAAKRTARAIAVDKKGRAKVVVVKQPAVRVRGGVAVSNEPNVKVTNRPTVDVGNQPTVTVANQPKEMAVSAPPGQLTATTRPPLDDVFNFYADGITNLAVREALTLPSGRSAAITNLSVTVEDNGSPVDEPTVAIVRRFVRESGTTACGGAGWVPTNLRRIVVDTDQTVSLDLAAAPLVIRPDDAGAPVCVGMSLIQAVGATETSFAADGYLFET